MTGAPVCRTPVRLRNQQLLSQRERTRGAAPLGQIRPRWRVATAAPLCPLPAQGQASASPPPPPPPPAKRGESYSELSYVPAGPTIVISCPSAERPSECRSSSVFQAITIPPVRSR